MAHGNFNTDPMYICCKGSKLFIRDENGKTEEMSFEVNKVIACDGVKYVSYLDRNKTTESGFPMSSWRRKRDFDEQKIEWYQLNIGYYGDWVYIDSKAFHTYFRPVVRKHIEVKEFPNEKELNTWLFDKDPSAIEKIGIRKNKYSVSYIDDGDEKYIAEFS